MKAVNLLPSEQRGSSKAAAKSPVAPPAGTPFGAIAVIAALAFAVVAVAAYVLTTNSIKDRQAELAAVTQETQLTQAKAAALQSFADFKSLAEQRMTTVSSLANSRFDWERTLTDLSRALPSDVHLKTVSGTTGTEVTAGSGARAAIQSPAVELTGCTTTQSAVARLMSRLRNVRGVTRVSLTKSVKQSELAAVVPTDPSGGKESVLCPKGSPPEFEIVVFFERANVAPGASPNVGAAAPTTATPAPGAAAGTTPPATEPAASSTTTPPAGQAGATQGVSTP